MSQSISTQHRQSNPRGYWGDLIGRWKDARLTKAYGSQNSDEVLAYPEARNRLRKEFSVCEEIGQTTEGNTIYLCDFTASSTILREVGRLRELTFRAVGEGTSKARDVDEYDLHYRHIVLWNDADAEIVGAYRIGEAFRLPLLKSCHNLDTSKLYTSHLFDYEEKFRALMPHAVELGRSFIQPKYWTRRGLDSLWIGIGAYLQTRPHIRYLFGAVSISNELPDLAKQQIVSCYQYYFQPDHSHTYAQAKMPFLTNRGLLESFRGRTFAESMAYLKASLRTQGVVLPPLYKHYADLCEPQGVHFIDFNIDPDFSFCIDGLMLVDLEYIKSKKRRRYLGSASIHPK